MKFMKKALTLTAISLALLLSSCNSQNSINNKTIKNAEKSAVSQAYANVDDILGKDYGNVKMPAKVTVYDFEKLYKLSVNYSCFLDQNIDYEKEGKEIFKKFFNEDFDESKCGFDIENYYYEYDDGNLYASYHQNFIALKIDFYSSGGEVEINQTAKIRDGENLQLDFGDKKIPASEVAEKASEYMTDFFGDYYGELVMQPFDIHTFDYDGEILAEVVFTQNYKGLDLECYSSHYSDDQSQKDKMIHFGANNIRCVLNSDFDIVSVYADYPDTIVKTEEITEIIPIDKACELLHNELSANSEYVFDDVLLSYSVKIIQPFIDVTNGETPDWVADYLKEPIVYSPMWCFICEDENSGYSRWMVRVDAITGEITIDAPAGKAGVLSEED